MRGTAIELHTIWKLFSFINKLNIKEIFARDLFDSFSIEVFVAEHMENLKNKTSILVVS